MIRRSNQRRVALLQAFDAAVPAFQEATDEVDEAAAAVLGTNRTDMRWLSVLYRVGAMSPSELATAAGLTRAAMTSALDRIERAGYVTRTREGADRRAVRVEVTDLLRQQCRRIYGPIATEGRRILSRYRTVELTAVLRFLEEGRALQQSQARRIKKLSVRP